MSAPTGTCRLDDDAIAAAARRYRSGEPVSRIAGSYGYSKQGMLNILRRAGVQIRPKGDTGRRSKRRRL